MSERRPPRRPQMEPMQEVLDRTRRIETRLTQLLIASGEKPHSTPPRFVEELRGIELSSPHTSLKEILDNIPAMCVMPVVVLLGGAQVAIIKKF